MLVLFLPTNQKKLPKAQNWSKSFRWFKWIRDAKKAFSFYVIIVITIIMSRRLRETFIARFKGASWNLSHLECSSEWAHKKKRNKNESLSAKLEKWNKFYSFIVENAFGAKKFYEKTFPKWGLQDERLLKYVLCFISRVLFIGFSPFKVLFRTEIVVRSLNASLSLFTNLLTFTLNFSSQVFCQ